MLCSWYILLYFLTFRGLLFETLGKDRKIWLRLGLLILYFFMRQIFNFQSNISKINMFIWLDPKAFITLLGCSYVGPFHQFLMYVMVTYSFPVNTLGHIINKSLFRPIKRSTHLCIHVLRLQDSSCSIYDFVHVFIFSTGLSYHYTWFA